MTAGPDGAQGTQQINPREWLRDNLCESRAPSSPRERRYIARGARSVGRGIGDQLPRPSIGLLRNLSTILLFRKFSGFFPLRCAAIGQESLDNQAMGTAVEILIDLSGRSRKVGRRNIAIAVSKVGYVHLRLIERAAVDRNAIDRTVIVSFHPRLVSQPTLAALAYKLANLDPERTVVVAELPVAKCWVFPGHMSALRMIGTLAGGTDDPEVAPCAAGCARPI